MNSNLAPLEFDPRAWTRLMAELAKSGGGRRESGAFLLGQHVHGVRRVMQWLHYATLDPHSQRFAYVRLGPQAFTQLWAKCAELGLEVMGDIHTHPGGPSQSPSDRAHPMVSIPGHLALIAPRFAQGFVRTQDVSVNRYLGNGRWQSFHGDAAAAQIHLREVIDERG